MKTGQALRTILAINDEKELSMQASLVAEYRRFLEERGVPHSQTDQIDPKVRSSEPLFAFYPPQ